MPEPLRTGRTRSSLVVPASRPRRVLLDALLGSWIEWREESASVQDAWTDWRDATHSESSGAFTVYQAALEREAAAAGTLARLCRAADHTPTRR